MPSETKVNLLQDRLPLWKLYFQQDLNKLNYLTGATVDQTKRVSGVEEVRSGRTRPETHLPPYPLRHRAFIGGPPKPFPSLSAPEIMPSRSFSCSKLAFTHLYLPH
jgi:hypothetical protein